MEDLKDDVIWLDGGCKLKGNLDPIRHTLESNGIWSPISSGSIRDWTHPSVMSALGVTNKIAKKANRSGGVIAAKYRREPRRIIQKWKNLAMEKRFLCPKGATRANHRQDQSILSVLMAQSEARGQSRSLPNLFTVQIHQDID